MDWSPLSWECIKPRSNASSTTQIRDDRYLKNLLEIQDHKIPQKPHLQMEIQLENLIYEFESRTTSKIIRYATLSRQKEKQVWNHQEAKVFTLTLEIRWVVHFSLSLKSAYTKYWYVKIKRN